MVSLFCSELRSSPRFRAPGGLAFQIDEPLQVVAGSLRCKAKVAHHSHAAHHFSLHVAHGAEDVFDAGAWRGDPVVALLLRVGNRFVGTAFALDLYAPASRC